MTPEVFIFDLGGVLVRIVREPVIESVAGVLGTSTGAVAHCLASLAEPYETGTISTGEAIERLIRCDGSRFADGDPGEARGRATRLVAAALASRFVPIGPVVEIAHRLRAAGHTLALASNTNPLDFDAVRSSYPDIIAPFGGRLFLSHEMGVMKPDRRFYRDMLARLGIGGEQAVFVDDRSDNVESAGACGIHGIRFTQADELSDALARLGVTQ